MNGNVGDVTPRARRRDPERTEPIRNPSGRPAGPGWPSTAARGVELGYQVVEEHIRQGREQASRAGRQRGSHLEGLTAELQVLAERSFITLNDTVTLGLKLLGSLAQNGSLQTTNGNGHAPDATGGHEAGDRERRLAVAVASPRPAEARLELHPHVESVTGLLCDGLRARDDSKKVIEDVHLTFDDGEAVLRVTVSADQPADLYSGLLVDSDSGRPLGTLTLRIRE